MRMLHRCWTLITGQPLAILVAMLATACALGSIGCAFGEFRPGDPFDRAITLEDAQHRYTVLVRWSDFDRAAAFVSSDERAGFLATVPNFRDLRFTEYESAEPEIDSNNGTATVEVTYYAYTPASPVEIMVHERQEWSRSGLGNHWSVRPQFTNLESVLASSR